MLGFSNRAEAQNMLPEPMDDAVTVTASDIIAQSMDFNVITGMAPMAQTDRMDRDFTGLDEDEDDEGNTITVTRFALGDSLGATPTNVGGAISTIAMNVGFILTITANGRVNFVVTGTAVNALPQGGSAVLTFTYEVTDGQTRPGNPTLPTAELTITITGENEAPTASDSTLSFMSGMELTEDGTHTFAVDNFSFTDVDTGAGAMGTTLASVTISAVTGGTLVDNDGTTSDTDDDTTLAAGNLPYEVAAADIPNLVLTPENRSADYNATITYTVSDGIDPSGSATLTIPVVADSDLPEPMNDAVTVTASDIIAQSMDFNVITGMAPMAQTDRMDRDFTGLDEDEDDEGNTITVTRFALGDSLGATPTNVGGAISTIAMNVGFILTITANGRVNFVVTGTAVNALPQGGSAVFTFTYEVDDGQPRAGNVTLPTATLTITITGENDAPTASDSTLSFTSGMELQEEGARGTHTFAVEDFSFTDVDTGAGAMGTALASVAISAVTGGTLQLSSNPYTLDTPVSRADIPNLVFSPENRSGNYNATITYTVSDGIDPSGSATLTIPVEADDDTPAVSGSPPAVMGGTAGTPYSQPLAVFFTGIDTDQTHTYALATGFPCTGFRIDGSNLIGSDTNGVIPAGTATVTCAVTANDGTTTSAAASVAITVTAQPNTPPTLTLVTIPPADTAVREIGHNQSGDDSAGGSYTAADGQEALSALTIAGCADTVAGTACSDTQGNIMNVPANSNTTFTGIYGVFTLNDADNTSGAVAWTYALTDTAAATQALDENDPVTDVLRIRADDGTADATTPGTGTSRYSALTVVTVDITGSNDAPTTAAGTLTGITEDQTRTLATSNFTFMDVDEDHTALHSVSFTTLPQVMGMSVSAGVLHNTSTRTDLTANATVMADDLDDIEYRPVNRSATYTAEIGFTVSDGSVSSAASTLSIVVTADNDDPILTQAGMDLTNLTYQTGADIGAALGAGYAASLFEAVDAGDTLAYTITAFTDTGGTAVNPQWLTLAPATGTFTGTAPAVTTGSPFSITVTATATPSGSETLDKTFTITLSSQVQQPIVVADTVTITEADALAIRGDGSGGVMGNARDGGTATATPNSVIPGGTLAADNLNGNASATVRRYDAGNAITTSAQTAGSGSAQGAAEPATDEGVTASFSMAENGDFVFDVTSAASTVDALPMGTDAVFVFSYDLVGAGNSLATYNPGTITFTVTGQNDAPVAADPPPTATPATLGAAYSLPLAQFFRDPDTGDSVTSFSLFGACTGFAIDGTGTNLIGSSSGSLPSSGVAMPTTCMVIGNDGVADSAAVPIAITVMAAPPATPAITISSFPNSLADNADLVFTLTRASLDNSGALTVGYSYTVGGGTAVNRAATFTAGETTEQVTIAAATLGASNGDAVVVTLLGNAAAVAASVTGVTANTYDVPADNNAMTLMRTVTVTAAASTTPAIAITTFPSALADNANLEVVLTRTGGNTGAPLAVGYSYRVASNATVYGTATFGASSATANITVTAATLDADATETVTFTLLNPTDSASNGQTVGAYDIPSSGNGLTRMVTVTAAPTTTPEQMRMERNRDTEQVVTQFARTLSLGAVNTVRQRTLSLGPRSPRAQQAQSSVDVDVTGLLDFAMSRAGVEAPSSGNLLQSLGSSGGMSGAMMDYAESYAMSRAQQVAAETSPFVNDAQALETERFVGGLEDGALGDPAAGGAHLDLASLGEGLVSSAAGRRGGGWTDGSMRFWASAEHGEVSSSPRTGVNYSDDTTTISLGMEKHFGGNKLLGVAASWLKGEPEFTAAGGVRGKAELEQWSLNPYIAYSFGSSRVWATVGVGVGSMDYSDNRSMGTGTASSDTTSVLYAVGAEQDIAELGGVDLLARVEAAGANVHLSRGDNLYDAQDVDSAGVRAELEAGYSVVAGDGHYRPYVTVGYRADGGDSSSDDAVEYGGGLLVGTGHLTVVASARGQESTGGGSDDRTSYSLELAYDRDQDQRGLNLSVRNSIGNVDSGIWADSYDYGASSSPSMRGLMNMRAGYGHEIGNWLLTPYVESDLDNGDMARWSMGLGADFGTGVVELTHTARPGQSAAPAESMLQLRLEFQ